MSVVRALRWAGIALIVLGVASLQFQLASVGAPAFIGIGLACGIVSLVEQARGRS